MNININESTSGFNDVSTSGFHVVPILKTIWI